MRILAQSHPQEIADLDMEHAELKLFVEADPAASWIEVAPNGAIVALCETAAASFGIVPTAAVGSHLSVLCDRAWAEERLALRDTGDKRPVVAAEIRAGRYCHLFVVPAKQPGGARLMVSRVSVPPLAILAGPVFLLQHTWGALGGLTRRQIEVLRLVSQGLDNTHIADAIFKTRRTAEWHLRALYRSLGTKERVELFRVGHEAGLGAIPDSTWTKIIHEWHGNETELHAEVLDDDTLAA